MVASSKLTSIATGPISAASVTVFCTVASLPAASVTISVTATLPGPCPLRSIVRLSPSLVAGSRVAPPSKLTSRVESASMPATPNTTVALSAGKTSASGPSSARSLPSSAVVSRVRSSDCSTRLPKASMAIKVAVISPSSRPDRSRVKLPSGLGVTSSTVTPPSKLIPTETMSSSSPVTLKPASLAIAPLITLLSALNTSGVSSTSA